LAYSTRVDSDPFISLPYPSSKKYFDKLGGSMEVIVERLLIELAVFAAQFAILRIVNWLRERSSSPVGHAAQTVAA
jgi:hypothetical protein